MLTGILSLLLFRSNVFRRNANGTEIEHLKLKNHNNDNAIQYFVSRKMNVGEREAHNSNNNNVAAIACEHIYFCFQLNYLILVIPLRMVLPFNCASLHICDWKLAKKSSTVAPSASARWYLSSFLFPSSLIFFLLFGRYSICAGDHDRFVSFEFSNFGRCCFSALPWHQKFAPEFYSDTSVCAAKHCT